MSEVHSDSRELRNAFGCFPTGITVVTTFDQGGHAVGVTANSFASLSLDPPLLLWNIGRQSATFGVFISAPAFVVSVLPMTAVALSRRFAAKGTHLVDEAETIPTELGPPAFADALAIFECEAHARYEGGDHVILVGRIKRFGHTADPARKGPGPLVYYRGRYGTVVDLAG